MSPSGPTLEALRGFAHELADLADARSLPAFREHYAPGAGQRGVVETKPDGTPVTAIDRDIERALRTAIRTRFPDHAVLGEEDGLEGPDHAPRWVLDPIDGTRNFVAGNPVFATLIALQIDGQEVLGVASAPALGSRWDGMRGGPARQDRREVRVRATTVLEQAQVSFGGLGYFPAAGRGAALSALTAATARQRGFGDFWQHCLVAAGVLDLALEAQVSLWDLAAVRAIVEAAGGRFTDLDGRPTAAGGSALSSNGHLHDEVLALLAHSTDRHG